MAVASKGPRFVGEMTLSRWGVTIQEQGSLEGGADEYLIFHARHFE